MKRPSAEQRKRLAVVRELKQLADLLIELRRDEPQWTEAIKQLTASSAQAGVVLREAER